MTRWTEQERDGRQAAMFDVVVGEVVAPLDRQAPSEREESQMLNSFESALAMKREAEREAEARYDARPSQVEEGVWAVRDAEIGRAAATFDGPSEPQNCVAAHARADELNAIRPPEEEA